MRGNIRIACIAIISLFCGVLTSHSVSIDGSSAKSEHYSARMPTFLIAGTQKSGTTVLAALLSEHPRVQLSRRKEVHYFDKVDNFNKGNEWYHGAFPDNNHTCTTDKVDPILGEATPYYVASRKACKRISDTIPGAKIIILLREPVARAYSEFQMKQRRIIAQEEFLRLVNVHEAYLYGCMTRSAYNFSVISACVPAALSQHSRYNKLVTAWKKALEATKDWHSVIDACFPSENGLLAGQGEGECGIAGDCKHSSRFDSTWSINHHITALNTSSSSTRRYLHALVEPNTPPAFNATSCWTYYKPGLETVKSLKDAMMGEITAFRRCRVTFQHTVDVNHLASPVDQRLERLDQAVDHCLNVHGGISTQYFYRSMYAVQLYHCFKSIPAEQFLIIPSGRLRRQPSAVLEEVLAFLEVPTARPDTSNATSAFDVSVDGLTGGMVGDAELTANQTVALGDQQALIRATVEKHFPNFAANTGWDFNSSYEPLPEYLAEYMQNFFEEQNQLLFLLLNQSFADSW